MEIREFYVRSENFQVELDAASTTHVWHIYATMTKWFLTQIFEWVSYGKRFEWSTEISFRKYAYKFKSVLFALHELKDVRLEYSRINLLL